MGASSVASQITPEEYLRNPDYEHSEYVDGQPVELNVVGVPHSRIQLKCGRKLDEYLDQHPGGFVAVEMHCKLSIEGESRFRLPDVALVLARDAAEDRYLDRAPDLVVEIRSPDDSIAALLRKMDEYFANGAKLGWLILPEEKSVLVITADRAVRTAVSGETLDGGGLLPELQIPVDELFA